MQAALERLQLLDREEFLGAVNLVFGLVFFAILSQEASAVVNCFIPSIIFFPFFLSYYMMFVLIVLFLQSDLQIAATFFN